MSEKITNRASAVSLLRPTAQFALRDDVLEWYSEDLVQPTESEIDAKLVEMQAEYDAQEYARNRASAFPSIGDQMDMQYWDSVNGTTTWKDAIAKVKSDNPKA
tara:strand:- start:202 stop:510 length:309 start_codon:yes stop_codon:yes gene_type:complete